jgi:WD40-like Beta Propeller Repeat
MGVMGARRWVVAVLVFVLAPVGCALAWAAPAGAVVSEFGSFGEEAGQFDGVSSVAVDQASGDVYLYDRGNLRIDKFSGEGAFVLAWGWGVADGVTQGLQTCTTSCFAAVGNGGPAAGEFSGQLLGVAVDNDPLSPSYEDVYVSEDGNHRVQRFSPSGAFLSMFGGEVNEDGSDVCLAGEKCRAGKEGKASGEFETMRGGIAVDSNGDVFVGDHERVQEFSPEGVFVKSFAVGPEYPRSLAVDSVDDVYVLATELRPSLAEYDSSGAFVRALDTEGEPYAVTVDPSGDVFVGNYTNMLEYGPGGEELASFDQEGARGDGLRGIAFGETIDRIYVPEGEAGRETVRLVSPPVPGPLVESESVSGLEPQGVTLNATIDPEGNDTTYHFEYGTSASYGTSTPVPDEDIGSGFEDRAVSVPVSGLSVSTTYHYRVVATDSKGRVTDGPDQTFTTLQAALIDDESVSEVASGSATLQGQLNPFGSDTTYHFEYGTSTSYGESAPVPGGEAVSGKADVAVSAHVQDLQPATTYHYRVVAQNALGSVQGEDHVFTTQAAGGGFALLDGRGWEMVSPPDKQGSGLLPINGVGAVIQASVDGSAISYAANGPTEAEPPGNRALELVQLFSKRGTAGWATKVIATPNDEAAPLRVGNPSEYLLFSSDLSLGLVEPRTETRLSEEASARTPYLRHDYTCEASLTACYQPLLTPANLPSSGTKFAYATKTVTATPDLSHVLLESLTALTSGFSNNEEDQSIYEWSGGSLRLVSILPDGKPAVEEDESADVGGGFNVTNAISADGSRIAFTTFQSATAEWHLYVRDISKGETLQADAVEPGARGGIGHPRFETASSDGSRVFFTDTSRLTVDSTASARESLPDLYEFDVDEGKLTDITVDGNRGEHADVQGMVQGASKDGSYVYFVANGVLAPGAVPGHCAQGQAPPGSTCNLYVRHEGVTKFIASLSYIDQHWGPEAFGGDLGELTARVSPDGRWFAFMSERSLTDYDNRDANSGESDEEVFLYDASTARLRCVSCNPTGARPVGVFRSEGVPGLLVDLFGIWPNRWLAGSIPGWTKVNEGHALYQSRYLSDGGRMFFNSNDALVAQDVNGTEDVYEYEPEGVGDCTSARAGFSETLGGCVGLVSSGSSSEESVFLDASENGDDVFFLTSAELLPQDFDSSLDLYDAHVCSNSSPCLPAAPASPPPCSTGDSCKPAPALQPTVFGVPSSATFAGAGNVTAPTTRVVRPRSLSRAQELARALRACHRKRSKRKRAVCERLAHKRYAAKLARKSVASKSSLPGRLSIASGR